ncbi:hypothetical protein JWS13_04155 (plasmid) [Rhodococcus pseudokoreensis]|uniref:Homeodomain-like domain-containing protein n=1 Tax=Rhodococcus pseudokoreensis TaxID=2811421 RepID=A0A974ZRU8_9NOCA|nr:hypothetical protein [Rhodococcus pseudokoreensis]QSE87909.1 hypothetical protein JWS13_04155 [Rhodococcus pseudokoreensis]
MSLDHHVHTDDERDAFQLHESGLTWTQIAHEIGCTEATAQAFAAAYQQRTDTAAAETQISLF